MEEGKIKLYDKKIHLMQELEELLGIEKIVLVYELLRVEKQIENYDEQIEVIK